MKPQIPYRITIEMATNGRQGVTLQFTGETPDLREGDSDRRPTDYELTRMGAAILQLHATQAEDATKDRAAFDQQVTLMRMPVTGGVN